MRGNQPVARPANSSPAPATSKRPLSGRHPRFPKSPNYTRDAKPSQALGNFQLHSPDNESIGRIQEHIASQSLDRLRVCVVTIVSKSPLGETVQSQLVQALVSNGKAAKTRMLADKSCDANEEDKTADDIDAQRNSTLSSTLSDILNETDSLEAENQVVGHVNYDSGLIVLNLSSFLDANKLHELSKRLKAQTADRDCKQFNNDASNQVPKSSIRPSASTLPFLEAWPTWNQNTQKTLLLLFSISHIVAFYNPSLCFDYNLVNVFKILQTLRLKSQSRVANLLETLATGQIFSQKWIRQARIACPRVLFICDTNHHGAGWLDANSLLNLKQNLENQIYLLLKKTDLNSRQVFNGELQQQLFNLPEKDFVFVFNRLPASSDTSKASTSDGDDCLEKKNEHEDVDLVCEKLSALGFASWVHSQQAGERQSRDQNTKSSTSQQQANLTVDQLKRFSKFMQIHVGCIQEAAKCELDVKFAKRAAGQLEGSTILPRLDDFFDVISRLKCLLFPQTTAELPADQVSAPDERRFVDIYNLTNCDKLFSRQYCYKMRLAAFESYKRTIEQQAGQASCVANSDNMHRDALKSAQSLYLNHARGQACIPNLELLTEACEKAWHEFRNSQDELVRRQERNSPGASVNDRAKTQVARSASLAMARPSWVNSSPEEQSPRGSASRKSFVGCDKRCQQSSLTFSRQANGIKIVAPCECCGNATRIMVAPSDRSKKLERVEIFRLQGRD